MEIIIRFLSSGGNSKSEKSLGEYAEKALKMDKHFCAVVRSILAYTVCGISDLLSFVPLDSQILQVEACSVSVANCICSASQDANIEGTGKMEKHVQLSLDSCIACHTIAVLETCACIKPFRNRLTSWTRNFLRS